VFRIVGGSALVIGGGIAKIQTSIDLTELRLKNFLVERELAFYLSKVKQKNNKYLLFSKLSVRSTIFRLNWINFM
jgi:heterodisulfide reductase subunit A-like polyferredoxin